MHSVPSLHDLITPMASPSSHVSSFHGGSSSHRLKHLEKSDRRGNLISFTTARLSMEICQSTNNSASEVVKNFHQLAVDLSQLTCGSSKNLPVNDLGNTLSKSLNLQGDKNLKNFHQLAVDLSQLTCGSSKNLSVNDLGNNLSKSLKLQGDKNLSSGSMKVCDKNGFGKEDSHEDPHLLENSTSEKFLSKSASFPCSENVSSPAASVGTYNDGKTGDGEDKSSALGGCSESGSSPYQRSLSFPTSLKIVPALKGSREKHGVPLKKLTVTWAPDVYDPTPTAVSHVVTNKSTRHRNDSKKNKKNSKNKQKAGGKSILGSKGKDKKQARKYSGNSNRCFKPQDDNVRVVDQVEHQADMVDFKIGSPDPYCGTSFLKNVTKLHFSVAEAT